MKTIVTLQAAAVPVMKIENREKPELKPGYSLIKMRSATLNQLSNTIRTGGFGNLAFPLIQGNEGAGIVEQSDLFRKGERVAIHGGADLGITADGLFQEWVAVENYRLMPLPDNMTMDEGAAFTVNYLTAYESLRRIAAVQAGDYVLVSGSTGSVGRAIVQTARALGAKPIALVSSDRKAQLALKDGASFAINWAKQDTAEEVRKITAGKGADIALDPVGGEMFSLLLKSLRQKGTLVSIGFTGGLDVTMSLMDIIVSEISIRGYSLFENTREENQLALQELSLLAARGELKPLIDSRYSMEDFEMGYQRLKSRQAIGSITVHL